MPATPALTFPFLTRGDTERAMYTRHRIRMEALCTVSASLWSWRTRVSHSRSEGERESCKFSQLKKTRTRALPIRQRVEWNSYRKTPSSQTWRCPLSLTDMAKFLGPRQTKLFSVALMAKSGSLVGVCHLREFTDADKVAGIAVRWRRSFNSVKCLSQMAFWCRLEKLIIETLTTWAGPFSSSSPHSSRDEMGRREGFAGLFSTPKPPPKDNPMPCAKLWQEAPPGLCDKLSKNSARDWQLFGKGVVSTASSVTLDQRAVTDIQGWGPGTHSIWC